MHSQPNLTIKQIFTSGSAHLIVDSNNKLWVMGSNKHWRLGVQPELNLSKPRSLGIWLEEGETVNKFHVNQRLTAIYTSAKRLLIAHVVAPSVSGKQIAGLDETKGKYLYPAVVPVAPSLDSWPIPSNPPPIVPYARTASGDLPDLSDLFESASVSLPPAQDVPKESDCIITESEETGGFGIDRDANALEAVGHDFGLANHFYGFSNLFNAVGDLFGAELSMSAGFIEPLTDIDEVVFAAESIFFRRGPNMFVYNWRLTAKALMFSNGGLAFTPHQHAKTITYYQIILPFKPNMIEFRDNYIYMRCELAQDQDQPKRFMHHVLTTFRRVAMPLMTVCWMYFPFEDLDRDQLYVSTKTTMIYAKQGSTVWQLMHLFKELRPIIQDSPRTTVLRREDNKSSYPICLRADGALLEYLNGRVYCQFDPWLEHVIYTPLFKDHPYIVVVDVSSSEQEHEQDRFKVKGDVLLVNVHGCSFTMRKHRFPALVDPVGDVYLYLNRVNDVPYLQLVKEFATKNRTHRIYKWLNLPGPVDRIITGSSFIMFESQGRFYRSTVTDVVGPLVELTLEPVKRVPASVNKDHIKRLTTKGGTNVDIQVEVTGDLFGSLCSFAEMFGKDIMLRPIFTHKSERITRNVGTSRAFVEDALSQFAYRYLLTCGPCPQYNIEALSALSTPQLFITGRALHMAMYMNRTCLSIRMPISFYVALLGREPELDELEFFLQQVSPDLYDTITSCHENKEAIAECGYTSYRELLNHKVFYEHADPETNAKIRTISTAIAIGFNTFAEIENIKHMNMPTLDYYISGSYSIDRALLIRKLKCSSSTLLKFVRSLIERLPEDRLAILLRNWTGSSVYKGTKCRIQETSNSDIRFSTCNRELYLNPKLFEKDSRLTMPDLIDILTSPVLSIKGA